MRGMNEIYTTSGTNINQNELDKFLINSIYQGSNEITVGAVKQIRPFPIWDEKTLNAIGEQRFEGLFEIFPQLSKETRLQIVSLLQSSLQEDLQGEIGSVQESALLGSISDIEQQVQSMRTKPQKGTKFLQMMGIVEERISPEND